MLGTVQQCPPTGRSHAVIADDVDQMIVSNLRILVDQVVLEKLAQMWIVHTEEANCLRLQHVERILNHSRREFDGYLEEVLDACSTVWIVAELGVEVVASLEVERDGDAGAFRSESLLATEFTSDERVQLRRHSLPLPAGTNEDLLRSVNRLLSGCGIERTFVNVVVVRIRFAIDRSSFDQFAIDGSTFDQFAIDRSTLDQFAIDGSTFVRIFRQRDTAIIPHS